MPDKLKAEPDPTKVQVVNPEPIEVTGELTAVVPHAAPPAYADNPASAAASTTSEQDRQTAGQRQINVIWETTQMRIALSVIWASLVVSGVLALAGQVLGTTEVQLAAVVFMFGVANLVTGFYFGRTNHQRGGGVDSSNERTR